MIKTFFENQSFNSKLVLIVAGLGMLSLSLLVAWLLDAPKREQAIKAKKETSNIEFCKRVYESIKPGDPVCGQYLVRLRTDIAAEKADQLRKEEAQAILEKEARNPDRTISDYELLLCREVIREGLRDPSSFKEIGSTKEMGGLIDYTATNGFGGRNRETFKCTTILN